MSLVGELGDRLHYFGKNKSREKSLKKVVSQILSFYIRGNDGTNTLLPRTWGIVVFDLHY